MMYIINIKSLIFVPAFYVKLSACGLAAAQAGVIATCGAERLGLCSREGKNYSCRCFKITSCWQVDLLQPDGALSII